MLLKRTSGIIIPNTHPDIEIIKDSLTFKGVDYNDNIINLKLYKELDEDKNIIRRVLDSDSLNTFDLLVDDITEEDKNRDIIIPRYYPLQYDEVEDNTCSGIDIEIESSIVPRNDRQLSSIDFLTKTRNCILKLEPGTGKTVITIAAISQIKKKTIILVHKDSLRKNWIEEIVQHTSLNEEDVGVLCTDPKKYREILSKPIIVSTVQTFASGTNNKDFIRSINEANIGLSVFDECHTTVGPDVFTLTSYNLNTERVIGLSATPVRSDLTVLLNYHLGEVKYFEPEKNELVIPNIYMAPFHFKVFKHNRYFMFDGKLQYSRYYSQMHKSEKFVNTASHLIRTAYEKGRKILVLGHSIDTLLKVAANCCLPCTDVGIFIPGSTKENRLAISDTDNLTEAFKTKTVVFSTYLACRDGNNRPELDFLVMITPTNNVEQAVGRINRYKVDKPTPTVIDLVDLDGPMVWPLGETSYNDSSTKVSQFVKSAQKRQLVYKELNWPCHTLKI